MESCPATFQSPYKQHAASATTDNPRQCVLLRAGGHLSVLDMDQGMPLPISFLSWLTEAGKSSGWQSAQNIKWKCALLHSASTESSCERSG